jgi:hypothetical protein
MLSIRRFWNAIWPLDRNLELGPESVCATEFSPLIYSLGLWKTWEICGKLILCADLADTLRSSWAKAKLGVLVDYAFWYSSLQPSHLRRLCVGSMRVPPLPGVCSNPNGFLGLGIMALPTAAG